MDPLAGHRAPGSGSSNFKGFERAEDFTTENGMLTPSRKVKRRFVRQQCGKQIEALYVEAEKPKASA